MSVAAANIIVPTYRLHYVLVAKAFCEQKLILPAVFATPRLGVAITLVPKHNNIVPPKSTIL